VRDLRDLRDLRDSHHELRSVVDLALHERLPAAADVTDNATLSYEVGYALAQIS
jgi:hypothetical protein